MMRHNSRRVVVMFNNIDAHLIRLQEEFEQGDNLSFPRICIASLDDVDYAIMKVYLPRVEKSVTNISCNKATTVLTRERVFVQQEGGLESDSWQDVTKVYLVWHGVLP